MLKPIINIATLAMKEFGHGEHYQAKACAVGPLIGAKKLGYRVVEVPPGKRAWPYHAHLVNEEMIFVIEGEGTLRHADHEYRVHPGDFIASPADANQPHQLINTSSQPLRYLVVSTMMEPDVFLYPDSDKFGMLAGSAPGGEMSERSFYFFGRKKDQIDYWDGE